jgi:hypothetical protein
MTTELQSLAKLSHQDPTPEYFAAFHEEINTEKNDRGAAILLACNVEICLRFAIDRNLTIGTEAHKELFHIGGAPLRSFEAKIRIGYNMGLYRDQTKHNLDCIKGIRNAFAHAVIPIKFETPEVKAVCDTMTMPEICFPRAIDAKTLEPRGTLPADASPRITFQKICEAISHNLFMFGTTSRGIPSDPEVGVPVKRVMPKPLP